MSEPRARTGLAMLIRTEARLIRRDPVALFFTLFFPPIMIALVGLIPAMREALPGFDGSRLIDRYTPITVPVALATMAVSMLPAFLASYREKGVLRRMAVTPVRPSALLGAQMAVQVALSVVAIALVLVAANRLYGVALPGNLAGFLLGLVLSAAALMALGLLIAALAPSTGAASAIGMAIYFPLLFFAGVWYPREWMPAALRRVGDFTPSGAAVQALQDAWGGGWPRPLALGVLAALALVAGTVAARRFRWE